jgi:hypothetical protein
MVAEYKKIRVLTVSFDAEIQGYEIPAFRGAIVQKVGLDKPLFHNHDVVVTDKLTYRYPLIQYKTLGGHPTIMCIEEGVDEVHNFFSQPNWDIEISGRKLELKILDLRLNQFNVQVWDKKFRYRIRNWVALNSENYTRYQQLESMVERLGMLEAILRANILAFGKGIEWFASKQIETQILSSPVVHIVTLKKQKVMAFDLEFSTNVFLPNHIGLGKSTSFGFGVVNMFRPRNVEQVEE